LALGTAILYAPVLHFDFVNYDDPVCVVNNLHIRTVSWQSLGWCFQSTYANLWLPLTWMSHMLDFQLYGLRPGGHHATSLLLHIFNSTLLFVVLNRITKAFWRSAMVAALFAWHPLHVESVAWISERKDVLSAFFWMLTIWAYVRYAQDSKIQNARKKVFYALSLFFFALGLMAKPMLVTLPFVLLLLDWWPLDRLQLNQGATPETTGTVAFRPVLRLVMEKLPFLVLSIIACAMTLRAASRALMPLAQIPLLPRLVNALLSYFRYVEKMVWPQNLVAVYPNDPVWPGVEVMMAGVFLIVVSVAAIRLWKKRPFWLAGWLWYLGILVPAIGLVHVGAQPMADHYTYLPSIGIFIILCWEAYDIAIGWRGGRAILGLVAAAVLGACLVLSGRQLQHWRNSVTLFLHDLDVMPNSYMAHADYAAFLRDSFKLEQAQKECEAALRLAPNYSWAHNVLGGVFMMGGKYDKAEAELRTALRLEPRRLDVHLTLGRLALFRNLPVEAAAEYRSVLAFDITDPQAHCGLGQALAMQGKLDEARAQYAEALRLSPRYAEAHFQLGVVLAMQHKPAEAIPQYQTALDLNIQPDRADVLNNLAWILAANPHPEVRNGAQAVRFASEACKLTRDSSPLLIGTLAAAYAEAGRFDEAVNTAQKAGNLAQAQGNKALAQRNLELIAIYRSHHAYHENP
jgi:Tfp pilus assembly protein PilF